MKPDRRPNRVGEVWVRREANDAAVFDLKSGRLHLLNPSALAIWELCDGETSIEEMTNALSELTGMSTSRAHEEVLTTINSLANIGLVRTD